MSDSRREALAALRFNWSETPDHIWSTSPYHVDGVHERAEQEIRNGINDAAWSEGPSPIGLVLQGQKGVGKTHLLGWVRREVQRQKGYFFLITLNSGDTFWTDAADALLTGLSHTDDSGETQLALFLRRLCEWTGTPEAVTKAITGEEPLTGEDLQVFMAALRRRNSRAARECGDTARALVLCMARNQDVQTVGEDYLAGKEAQDDHARQTWGIRRDSKPAPKMVEEVSTLLALTGPSVMAVDQFDTLLAKAKLTNDNPARNAEVDGEVALVADGLMMLRQRTKRTLSIVACLPTSWQLLRNQAIGSVPDRFHEPITVSRISDPERAREFVEAWLSVPFQRENFDPPHPTWPVAPVAFENWDEYTAREILKRVHVHVKTCLKGTIRELTSFDPDQPDVTATEVAATVREPETFVEFDAKFAELRDIAEIGKALDDRTENEVVPGYLSAALRAWIIETGNDNMDWGVEIPSDTRVLHACLNRVIDEKLDIEEHWAFRAIAATHPRAALSRLRKARAAASGRTGSATRHLIVLREPEWSRGDKTRVELNEFWASGGKHLKISEDDLRTFSALEVMLRDWNLELLEWLVARQPASKSALLSEILPAATTPSQPPDETAPRDENTIPLGTAGGEPVPLDLETLRKHVVIFAGSGSGKTVLMRRIVEECALRGVSAIVLDSNNDLARLGDPWPSPPEQWGPGDEQLAKEYLANTDVVVWTPGRAAGRPLSFQPLPDFSSVLDDSDEFDQSVEAAVATLATHAKVNGTTDKASWGKAVLREALRHYARTGARSLPGFVELLADLPDGVSQLIGSQKIAAGLAQTLKAAMVNNPLLGGMGEPADPAALLTPAPGRKARISVISFVGLPSEDQRQGFVNQLQMEIFAWFKRNPAHDRPLGGLLVMDEAQMLAPAQKATASLYSTIVLASQARKYGLGLLFATQAPKGLHNQITGNATTQFVGRLQHATQIAAVQDIARTKGARLDDVGGLGVGQFYVTTEQVGFQLLATPFCLSHHPPSPLRDEEVLERARNGRAGG
ncbi:helicase HerA domain-containing protein [Actinophytocola sp.]|uniref:helicase HerA domain-containing protein n=1 Tax=Actinophytocola sp. TaxID=1872138 RepID=UPI002ED574F6